MVKAVFPGSFDPPTYGHLNIIKRGAALFDSLDVVVAVNSKKTPLLSHAEIKKLLEEQLDSLNLDKVRVTTYEGLVVDYCRSVGASVLLRGIRSSADFDYEFELSILNKQLNDAVETILIPTEPKYFVLRSSTIKELLNLGGDISAMVPPQVEKALLKSRGRVD
jgi:pantetheine-phosphate adenylyltransferase